MKRLEMFVNEKLKVTKQSSSQYTLFPKDKKELMHMIDDEVVKNGKKCSLNHIDVSGITDMSTVFRQSVFDGDITNWDVSNVDLMLYMFDYSAFGNRKSLMGWKVKKDCNRTGMFVGSPLEENEPVFNIV